MNHASDFGRSSPGHLPPPDLIRFGSHLVVGHPDIDARHKAIFELGASVYRDRQVGRSPDVLRPAVDQLSNLVRYCRALLAKRHNPDCEPSPGTPGADSDTLDDFWRGANAVCQRHQETGRTPAARSAARLEARLARRRGGF